MTFSAIVAGLFAIAKAVPVVAGYIEKFYELWCDKQIEHIDEQYHEISKQRKSLMKAITKATTDEERINLSIVLSKLNKFKL